MWNPVLLSIYHKAFIITQKLVQKHSMHLSLAMRRPPPSEFETYIVANRPSGCYNPMDPSVECFGLEIAIRNKDA